MMKIFAGLVLLIVGCASKPSTPTFTPAPDAIKMLPATDHFNKGWKEPDKAAAPKADMGEYIRMRKSSPIHRDPDVRAAADKTIHQP